MHHNYDYGSWSGIAISVCLEVVGSLFQILNNLIGFFMFFSWQIKSVHSKFYTSLVVEKESVSIFSYELARAFPLFQTAC
jgi:hypothetical protein